MQASMEIPTNQLPASINHAQATEQEKNMIYACHTKGLKKIAEMLNKFLPELGGVIKAKGKGETTRIGPGWTKENPTIPEQTAANRRYVLTPIQTVHIKKINK